MTHSGPARRSTTSSNRCAVRVAAQQRGGQARQQDRADHPSRVRPRALTPAAGDLPQDSPTASMQDLGGTDFRVTYNEAMSFGRERRGGSTSDVARATSGAGIGKHTRTEALPPVQRYSVVGATPKLDGAGVQRAAAAGA